MDKTERRKELTYLRNGHEAWKTADLRVRPLIEERVAAETKGARIAFFKSVYDEYQKPTRKSDLVAALGVTRPTLDRWLAEYVEHMGGEALADAMVKPEPVSRWAIVAQVGEKLDGVITNYPVVSDGTEFYEYEFRNGKHELLAKGTNDYIAMPEEARFLIERMS